MSGEEEHQRPRRWDLDQYKVHGDGHVPPDPFAAKFDTEADDEALLAAAYDANRIRARYRDDPVLLLLALRTAVLSVLTLGLYRFWMITRLRRYYANAIRIDGDPLEYTGTGLEKLLGFLLAVVVLAVYLGLVNVALTFIGLSFFQGELVALNLSILAAVPFYFWAVYRARRYVLSRLRWRGIRFGAEPGAVGYTLRSLALGLLTILTAGLALPYQHFKQAQYMTDRSWFGNQRFRQEGSWLGLMVYWIWIYLTAGIFALLTWGMIIEADNDPVFAQSAIATMVTLWIPVAMVVFFAYQVGSFRYLWDNRVLGESPLANDVSVRRVFFVYLGGYFMVAACTAIAVAVIGALVAGGWILLGGPALESLAATMGETAGTEGAEPPAATLARLAPLAPLAVAAIIGYLLVFAVSYALAQVFLVQPVLRRKVEAMLIDNPQALREAVQRDRDRATEAGGFADALGVEIGAGF